MNYTFAMVLVLGLVGCKDSEEITRVSPELVAKVGQIQEESGLSDEKMSVALKRWVDFYSAAGGLLESEEIYGPESWTPERLGELMSEAEMAFEEVRHEDQMLAVNALVHLSLLNDERYDDLAESLREILTRQYLSLKESPDETAKKFVNAVLKIAESDPELKNLLLKK